MKKKSKDELNVTQATTIMPIISPSIAVDEPKT